jgi:hypothetical protein
MSDYIDLSVLRNVVLVALVAGVGLTCLFAVGARALDRADRASTGAARLRSLGLAAMGLIGIAVLVGLWAVLRK